MEECEHLFFQLLRVGVQNIAYYTLYLVVKKHYNTIQWAVI